VQVQVEVVGDACPVGLDGQVGVALPLRRCRRYPAPRKASEIGMKRMALEIG
jgi:hypothetical protein